MGIQLKQMREEAVEAASRSVVCATVVQRRKMQRCNKRSQSVATAGLGAEAEAGAAEAETEAKAGTTSGQQQQDKDQHSSNKTALGGVTRQCSETGSTVDDCC